MVSEWTGKILENILTTLDRTEVEYQRGPGIPNDSDEIVMDALADFCDAIEFNFHTFRSDINGNNLKGRR